MTGDADTRLKAYREKRDFGVTPEPDGSIGAEDGRRYVIQKHAASRLHYDLRLELGGVLKSWAVTKGPSLIPSEKRLAVQTEDHPVGYETFEGVIPSGYGEGTVMVWDRGTWRPQGDDPEAELADGQLKIVLEGERLRGGFALVLMKNNSGPDRKNWLLVKERDDDARDGGDVLEDHQDSVVTGRRLDEIAAGAEAPGVPDFVDPQLATLGDEAPDGDRWIHEIKYDGYRLQARKGGDRVVMTTRNDKDWTKRYPAVAAAVAKLGPSRLVLDGELVALDADGHSRFELLQRYEEEGGTLAYYAFDLLTENGRDWRGEPLADRKARLADLLEDAPAPLRYADHFDGEGSEIAGRACDMALEGIISKRADRPYRSGRSADWRKTKCIDRDEFVIGGYRRSDKKARAFASLLVGAYEDGALVYRGRVGTGYTDDDLDRLVALLSPDERKTSPFADLPSDARRDAVWVTPKHLAQIAYTERTSGGRLRHPSFLGLREDKSPEGLRAESVSGGSDRTGGGLKDRNTPLGVRLTSPTKTMFTGEDITKRDLAAYLADVAALMLPHVRGRPMSLLRCPDGAGGKCFFQKHHGASVPDHVTVADIAEADGEERSYLTFDSAEALVSAAQIGAIELHGWGSRTDMLERPDRLVMDLDPGDGLGFADVVAAAREVRDVLDSGGLTSFPLLTGGKGIHVVVPLERRRPWADVAAAAQGLAVKLAEADPGRYVATASKEARRGRIFLDWLRNRRGQTAIMPYSPRARPGAPVAVPVSWDELSGIDGAGTYTFSSVRRRLAALARDPWEGHDDVRQSITDGFLEVVGAD